MALRVHSVPTAREQRSVELVGGLKMSEPLDKLSFSLAGCGFLGIFHIGVAACLREHVPHLLKDDVKFGGASAGALIAACLICDVSLNHCVDFTLRLAKSSRAHPLGGWEPAVDIAGILRASIEYVLPEDAHILCTNRLYVSCSGISDQALHMNTKVLENVVIHEFETRQDLIDVLMCSAFIPGFSAYGLPTYKGRYLFDGGLTDNLPMMYNNTITISPWAGEHSICPRDMSGHTFPMTIVNTSICPTDFNLVRFKDAFNPPPPELLKVYCWQGYDACLQFLSEHELIRCSNHRVLTHLVHVDRPRYPDCHDCRHQHEHAIHSGLSADLLEQLSPEEEETLSRGIGTLVATPIKAAVNFMAIPVVMLKDLGMQLYLAAYFGAKGGSYLEKCAELVERISNPRILIYNFITYLLSKAVFTGLEYLARVASVTLKAGSDIKYSSKNVLYKTCTCVGRAGSAALNGICLFCSLPIRIARRMSGCAQTEQTAPTPTMEQQRGTTQQTTEANVEVESHVAAEPCELLGRKGSAIAVHDGVDVEISKDHGMVAIDADPDDNNAVVHIDQHEDLNSEAEQACPSADVEEVAIDMEHCEPSMDSGHMSVVMDIQTKEVDVDPAEAEVSLDEAEVAGAVGPIDKVHFDSFTFAQNDEEVVEHREPRPKVLQEYVHKFEQYRPIMTMHYVDDENIQHTESLFADGSVRVSSHPKGQSVKDVEPTEVSEKQGAKNEEEGVEQHPHDVETGLKQLLEEKVLQPQRQFEKEYRQAYKKRRLKKGYTTEAVGPQSRHFRLQVVSFTEELPSPNLSRSNSVKNVNYVEDESSQSHLVRSTSDASQLTGRLKELRRSLVETKEQRQCWQAGERKGLGDGTLAASKEYCSMQTLAMSSVPALSKSMSDTSLVASTLNTLKMADTAEGSIAKSENRKPCSRSKRRKISRTVMEAGVPPLPVTTSTNSNSKFCSDMYCKSCSAPSLSRLTSSYQPAAHSDVIAANSHRKSDKKQSLGGQSAETTKSKCPTYSTNKAMGSKNKTTAVSKATGESGAAAVTPTDKSSCEPRMMKKVTRSENETSANSPHPSNHNLAKTHSVLRSKEEVDHLRQTLKVLKTDSDKKQGN